MEALQAPCGSRCCIGMIRMYMGSYIRHVHIHTSAYIYMQMYVYVCIWMNKLNLAHKTIHHILLYVILKFISVLS